jgi:hypothetical protein
MSAADLPHDPEFHPLPDKKLLAGVAWPPDSKLALGSLILGILSFFALPVLGAVIAVVLGHFSLAEIKASGGRLGGKASAKAGMVLGYLNLAIAAAVVVLLAYIFTYRTRSIPKRSHMTVHVGSPTEAATHHFALSTGIKMPNELTQDEVEFVAEHIPNAEAETLIGYANTAASTFSPPKVIVLTSRSLATVFDDRSTIYPLDEIESIDNFGGNSEIVVIRRSGEPMRLSFSSISDSNAFQKVLEQAWTRCTEHHAEAPCPPEEP